MSRRLTSPSIILRQLIPLKGKLTGDRDFDARTTQSLANCVFVVLMSGIKIAKASAWESGAFDMCVRSKTTCSRVDARAFQ